MNTGLYFSCQIGGLPDTTFDVVEFTLQEALSELFTLTLILVSRNSAIPLESQLLQKASLTLFTDGQKRRTINGIVASISQGDTGFKRTYYTVVIRPSLWRLTLTQNSRIFHFHSVPQILDSLLAEHTVECQQQLEDPHSVREYITQKRESDYDFFCRLAGEEGIMFWFEEEGMFYSDSHLGMTAGLTLSYNPHPQSSVREKVIHQFNYQLTMRPTEVVLKDYRYSHPDVPLKFTTTEAKSVANYSVFDSYGRFHDDKIGKQFSRYRLEALRADSAQGEAKSNSSELMPGKIFILQEHPSDSFNRRWQIVSITHHGTLPQSLAEESDGSPATLTNQFTFMPGEIDWRPSFFHKPTADGDEVATVVGPAGEEIYVNEDGCVRVHFHWNRYDPADENASLWVRVAQGWNGDGFGFLATPRIGQEVIVSYLNGDIDRPIITGTNYNGKNRPPLDLPSEKTKTTIKTKTHKGEGFNQLRFEDENGQQEIYIHAEKDMNTKVKHDRTTIVDNDHTETVHGHQSIEIDKNQTIHVHQNETETVDGNQTLLVKKNQTETVAIAKVETVGAAKALSIGTAYQTTVGMVMNTSVGLTQTSQVGITKSLLVGKSYSANIGEKMSLSVGEQKTETVGKVSIQSVGKHFELVCGKAKIVLTSDGTIYLKGEKIELQANSGLKGDADLIQWNCGASKAPPNAPE